MKFKTIIYHNDKLKILDQRLLPQKVLYRECRNAREAYYYIKTLAVRGAPAIGVFAAYGVYVGLKNIKGLDKILFLRKVIGVTKL